jgi:hypothetical protein
MTSARERINCGILRPSILAVFRLITSRKAVGCWTWQIGRLGALEYPSGVNASLAPGSRVVHCIADQAAGYDGLAVGIDRRNDMR